MFSTMRVGTPSMICSLAWYHRLFRQIFSWRTQRMLRRLLFAYLMSGMLAMIAPAAQAAPPLDLWPAEVIAKIRDPATLNHELAVRSGYFEVYYDSEIGDAKWADGTPPYAIHTGGTIRIHGFLASPLVGG